jgi:hypothetical protein
LLVLQETLIFFSNLKDKIDTINSLKKKIKN